MITPEPKGQVSDFRSAGFDSNGAWPMWACWIAYSASRGRQVRGPLRFGSCTLDSSDRRALPMNAAKCPWPQTDALQSICEADLCAWLVEPGNTLTNLAFLFVGLWILRSERNGSLAHWFGWLAIIIAAGSTAYHATGLGWARYLDYLSVYFITGVMTALNLRRWLKPRHWILILTAVLLPTALLSAAYVGPKYAIWIYVLGAPCCLIELRLAFRDWQHTKYQYYVLAWGAAGLGVLAWSLDPVPVLCRPNWHGLSGHSVWHVLAALSLLLTYKFYRQFGNGSRGEPHAEA